MLSYAQLWLRLEKMDSDERFMRKQEHQMHSKQVLHSCSEVSSCTIVTMGGDLQPAGCLADWLLTGLGQPQVNP